MAKDYIAIDRSASNPAATHGAMLAELVRSARDTYNKAKYLKGILEHNIDGADYSAVETICGVSAGNGQTLYNIIAGAVGGMEGTVQDAGFVTLTERVGI